MANSVKAMVNDIETQIEKKTTEGQVATQGKLESHFQAMQDANAAASSAKTIAVSNDKSWFECASDEQEAAGQQGLHIGCERQVQVGLHV